MMHFHLRHLPDLAEQVQLILMRNGKHSDNHPRIRSDRMPLLCRSQKEVKVIFQKLIEVLLAHLLNRSLFLTPASS